MAAPVGVFWGTPASSSDVAASAPLPLDPAAVRAEAHRLLEALGPATSPDVVLAMFSGIDTSMLYGGSIGGRAIHGR